MSLEGLLPRVCEVCTALEGEECNYCGVIVCEGCAKTELHNDGDFLCQTCKRFVCNSYNNTPEGNVCWFCFMKAKLDDLGEPVAQKFLALADSVLEMPEEKQDVAMKIGMLKIAVHDFLDSRKQTKLRGADTGSPPVE